MTRLPRLTAEDERELGRRARAGDLAARNEMVERMDGWAIKRAKLHTARAGRRHPLADLIQEARMGLIEGVDRFDPESGCRLQTYATYWIDQRLGKLCAAARSPVWIPVRLALHVLSGDPGPFATMTQASTDRARMALGLRSVRIRPVARDDDGTRGGLDPEQPGDRPADLADARMDAHAILAAIPRDNDRRALRLRFGFETGEPVSFPDVARMLGIGKSEASQSLVRVRKALTGRERLPRHLRPSPEYFPPKEATA